MLRLLPVFLPLALLMPFAAASTGDEDIVAYKLAMIIGNTAYQNNQVLPNARNDAEDVAAKLTDLGFKVLLRTDIDRDGFVKLLRDNADLIANAESMLFYFAGHGFQFEGKNYLVPVDSALDSSTIDKIAEENIGLDIVVRLLQDRERPTLVFLDACRNNPFNDTENPSKYQNGLAQVEIGDSTFVAFATQPGNTTWDGIGRNSPFTEAFLQHVTRPGLSISDLMIEVRKTVETITFGGQTPWDQSSLRQQFYFTGSVPVDPELLANNFKAILNDPKMREELQLRMASADPNALHQFILLNSAKDVSELSRNATERSVPGPAGTSPAQSGQNKVVASLQSGLTDDFSKLLKIDPGKTDREEEKVLARRVQTELARLGCYRMRIDGDWGRGSRKALGDFFAATRQQGLPLEPSIDVLTSLFLQSGTLCAAPKRVARRSEGISDASDGSSNRSSRRNSSGRKSSGSKKPAALPPDISAGVGIGGIF